MKNKKIRLTFLIVASLGLFFTFGVGHVSAGGDNTQVTPIPAGCPGSTLQGPPAPGSCESIPIGCPGSTLQGPPAPGFDINSCPYGVASQNTEDAKNRAQNTQDPGGITSAERENLADCDATDGTDDRNIVESKAKQCLEDNPIVTYFLFGINVLSAGVGVVAVIVIIIGGIQYSSAGGDPSKVKAAKMRITNAIIALVAYFFLFAFLQWIVPGGFF